MVIEDAKGPGDEIAEAGQEEGLEGGACCPVHLRDDDKAGMAAEQKAIKQAQTVVTRNRKLMQLLTTISQSQPAIIQSPLALALSAEGASPVVVARWLVEHLEHTKPGTKERLEALKYIVYLMGYEPTKQLLSQVITKKDIPIEIDPEKYRKR